MKSNYITLNKREFQYQLTSLKPAQHQTIVQVCITLTVHQNIKIILFNDRLDRSIQSEFTDNREGAHPYLQDKK